MTAPSATPAKSTSRRAATLADGFEGAGGNAGIPSRLPACGAQTIPIVVARIDFHSGRSVMEAEAQ